MERERSANHFATRSIKSGTGIDDTSPTQGVLVRDTFHDKADMDWGTHDAAMLARQYCRAACD